MARVKFLKPFEKTPARVGRLGRSHDAPNYFFMLVSQMGAEGASPPKDQENPAEGTAPPKGEGNPAEGGCFVSLL